MSGSALADVGFVAMGVVAAMVVVVWLVQRRSPNSERSRRRWIAQELARQEAAYPGGRFSDDEYVARLEALEERWDHDHGR